MYSTLEHAFWGDFFVALICSILLLFWGKINFYHPAPIYIFFHLYSFTSKLFFLSNGSNVFLDNTTFYTPASTDEIIRATEFADLGFIAMTIAWLHESLLSEKRFNKNQSFIYSELNDKVVNRVLYITGIIGTISFFTFLYLPGIGKNQVNLGVWEGSSYIIITEMWLILFFLILIYFQGIKTPYLLLLIFCLIILGIQGYHRFRIVTPILFLAAYYLYINKKKWPSLYFVGIAYLLFNIFLPLKVIGKAIQDNQSFEDLIVIYNDFSNASKQGNLDDQGFLETYAMNLSLVDQQGKFYYGTTFFPLLVSFVPRFLWTEKPSLAQWQRDISTKDRPIDELGVIATIYGESYANFGVFGVFLIPFFFASFMARWFFYVERSSLKDRSVIMYFLVFCILIQIYRDGLVALFVFPVINFMPFTVIYLFSRKRQIGTFTNDRVK